MVIAAGTLGRHREEMEYHKQIGDYKKNIAERGKELSPETELLEHKVSFWRVVNGLSGLMMGTAPFLAPAVGNVIEKGLEKMGYLQIDHVTHESTPILVIAVITYFFGTMGVYTLSEPIMNTYRKRHLEALNELAEG